MTATLHLHEPSAFRPLPPHYGYAVRSRSGFLPWVGDEGLAPGKVYFLPSASGPDARVFNLRADAEAWAEPGETVEAVWTCAPLRRLDGTEVAT